MFERGVFALAAALTIGCQGAEGPPGPPGQQGLRGSDGKDGKDGRDGRDGSDATAMASPANGPYALAGSVADTPYRPIVWLRCSTLLDLINVSSGTAAPGTDGVTETWLEYKATLFTNDDADVSCTVSIGNTTGSGGGYFPATTQGAQNIACLANGDYPPLDSDAGLWNFQINSTGASAKYVDAPSNPTNGTVHAFSATECSVMKLGMDGGWQSTSIAAVFGNS